MQKADFEEILEAMDGLPVTVRLLDPPLHEFLPSTSRSCAIKEATAGLDDRGAGAARRRPRRGHEHNPMLGTRGVRLGVVKPGLYAMQVRALHGGGRRACASRRQDPIVEIMIPLTVTREELALARSVGRGRDRRGDEGHEEEARRHDRHDDRDAAGRAARRRDRRGGRLLLLRHQRPHADDVRLQPRRRREPDDAGLPRAGPAQAQPVRDDRPDRRRRARAHRRRAGPQRPSRTSSSACAASTAATPSRSRSSTTPASTTCQLLAVPGADRPAGGGPGRRSARVARHAEPRRSGMHRRACSPAARRQRQLRRLRRPRRGQWAALLALIVALLLVDLLVVHREAARRSRPRRRRSSRRSGSRSASRFALVVLAVVRRRRRPASTSRAT